MTERIQESLLPMAVNIDDPILDARNARAHPAENIAQIKLSLQKYGQCKPVVVNARTGVIEAGNGMVLAARELGWGRIAVARVDHNKADAMGYALMDNKSALSSDWALPNLKDILQELDTGAFPMDATGFSQKEIEELMTQFYVGKTDDDAIPEKVETICKTGDLWQLSEHRLLCGDSTKKEDVERLMQGEKAMLMVTDPPYGIWLDQGWRDRMGINRMGKA